MRTHTPHTTERVDEDQFDFAMFAHRLVRVQNTEHVHYLGRTWHGETFLGTLRDGFVDLHYGYVAESGPNAISVRTWIGGNDSGECDARILRHLQDHAMGRFGAYSVNAEELRVDGQRATVLFPAQYACFSDTGLTLHAPMR